MCRAELIADLELVKNDIYKFIRDEWWWWVVRVVFKFFYLELKGEKISVK